MAGTVMVVEDDARIGALVGAYLRREAFTVVWVRSGEAALDELPRHAVDLVILDLGLPGMSGFDVCRRLGGRVPVIMLTARDEEVDRVTGLELGADDYVTKPFSPRELTARVKAVLRRTGTHADSAGAGAGEDTPIAHGRLRLDPGAREVHAGARAIALTQREFDLLAYLMRRPGRVVRRDELLEAVWGFRSPGQTRTVDVHVAQLRARLGQDAGLIVTVRGVGYKLVPAP